jgi:5-formyltetrahydrofolate cyclo-ligase
MRLSWQRACCVVPAERLEPTGARPGRGAGYSDIEVVLLTEAGLIGLSTVIVTTVHPLQVIDGPLPETGMIPAPT